MSRWNGTAVVFVGVVAVSLRSIRHVLEDEGTVRRIVTHEEGTNQYSAVRFVYGANARTVTHVLGETWTGGSGNYTVTFARQFRPASWFRQYDGARQRYLNRSLDPDDLDVVLSDTWSDYDGTSIYADFGFDGFDVLEERRSYMPGLAMTDQLAGGGAANTTYLHTSALGSTMGVEVESVREPISVRNRPGPMSSGAGWRT